MANFARIIRNVAVDVSCDPTSMYHPSIVAQFVPVPDAVAVGWIKGNANNWSAPAPQPIPPNDPIYPVVGVIAFKILFGVDEGIMSQKLKATDERIAYFWSLIDDPRADVVNLNLESVRLAIMHTLTEIKAAGVELDVSAKMEEILSGVPK